MEAAFLHKVLRDLQLQLPELSFYFINEEQMYLILVSPLLVISSLPLEMQRPNHTQLHR